MPHGKICYLEIPANRAEDSARHVGADTHIVREEKKTIPQEWIANSALRLSLVD